MARPIGGRGVAVALAGVLALGACAALTFEPVSSRTSSRPRPTSVAAGPRPAIRALRPLRPGTVVPLANVGVAVFADARHGFTLASMSGSETYPAATVDGGRTWRIDGPVLPALPSGGPAVISQPGIAGPRTYFVSEGVGGITVVDVTTDAGKRWWRTLLPGGPVFVGAYEGELTAIVASSTIDRPDAQETFWAFHSKTGRRWTYDDSLSAVT
jgi:hypothetical protein